jgi:hypothetical protein
VVRRVLPAIVLFVAGACAEGSTGDFDDGTPQIPDDDAGTTRDSGAADVGPEPDSSTDAGDPCNDALAATAFDFEAGDAGWTHGISDGVTPPPAWPYDPWTRGTATIGTACKGGSCFGAELGQNYAQCQRGYLLSPALNLTPAACAGRTIAIVFHHAHQFWTGSYASQTWFDGGVVEVSANGSTWTLAQGTYPGTVRINPNRTASFACVDENNFGVHNKSGFVGAQTTTTRVELTIPAVALSATTRVRFSMASGVSTQTTNANTSRSGTGFGWRIDDVSFLAK